MIKQKRPGNPNTNNNNIQPGYRNVIWHWKMYPADWEKRISWRNRITKSEKPQNACRERKLQVPGNIGCRHH